MLKTYKITVVGSGYVGMSLAVLLAQKNDVTILDINESRVKKINNKKSTVFDEDIQSFLDDKSLSLHATLDKESAYKGTDFIIIATPTNFNINTNYFDTSSVDSVVEDALKLSEDALIIIKSTIPIGHTNFLQKKFNSKRIVFSPEFLREGQALRDNLYPSRIIIGCKSRLASKFTELLKDSAEKSYIETLLMESTEAEAVKLYANTYLAMRISFFNELDTFALSHGLNAKSIIEGMCKDERIGGSYNNPSFGYGGYCLPKDTKQLLANYKNIPQSLIKATVDSNIFRKGFISDYIVSKKPKCVGFFRLIMKSGSDNFRESAVHEIIENIKSRGVEIIIYEPLLESQTSTFMGLKVVNDIAKFKSLADLIVANRMSKILDDVSNKVFTRDIFEDN